MLRTEKEAHVAAMHEAFARSQLLVITHQTGMTVAESTDLRRKFIAVGARFRVTKNKLARLALEGTGFEYLSDMFTGPTAVAMGADPVAAAKVVVSYAKGNEKLRIVGGGLGGQMLDAEAVTALTKLPSIEELRAKLLGVLNAPASQLVGVLDAPAGQLARVIGTPGGQLARVFSAYSQKSEAA